MPNVGVDENVSGNKWKNGLLSADMVFEILADGHRRAAVSYLLDRGSTVTVDELIDEVITSTDRDPVDVDNLRVKFRHVHLPKLRDVGVIKYQDVSDVVGPQPAIGQFKPLLD